MQGVKESMDFMKAKDANIQTRAHNNRILKEDLRKLVVCVHVTMVLNLCTSTNIVVSSHIDGFIRLVACFHCNSKIYQL